MLKDVFLHMTESLETFMRCCAGFLSGRSQSPPVCSPEDEAAAERVKKILSDPPPFHGSLPAESWRSQSLMPDDRVPVVPMQEVLPKAVEPTPVSSPPATETLPEEPVRLDYALLPLLDAPEFLNINAELLLLLKDRLSVLDEMDAQSREWAVLAVDLLDEMRVMEKSYTEFDRTAVAQLEDGLRKKFGELAIVVIDRDTWTPAEQRAISVTEDANVQIETIARKSSLGVMRDGKLLKKQEVYLCVPPKQTTNPEEVQHV